MAKVSKTIKLSNNSEIKIYAYKNGDMEIDQLDGTIEFKKRDIIAIIEGLSEVYCKKYGSK